MEMQPNCGAPYRHKITYLNHFTKIITFGWNGLYTYVGGLKHLKITAVTNHSSVNYPILKKMSAQNSTMIMLASLTNPETLGILQKFGYSANPIDIRLAKEYFSIVLNKNSSCWSFCKFGIFRRERFHSKLHEMCNKYDLGLLDDRHAFNPTRLLWKKDKKFVNNPHEEGSRWSLNNGLNYTVVKQSNYLNESYVAGSPKPDTFKNYYSTPDGDHVPEHITKFCDEPMLEKKAVKEKNSCVSTVLKTVIKHDVNEIHVPTNHILLADDHLHDQLVKL